jgi:hypothetical protein
MYKIVWHEGEYLSGWMVTEGAEELKSRGLAQYVSWWGVQVQNDVADALAGRKLPHSGEVELAEADVARVEALLAEAKAKREAKLAQVEMVKCSCGHTVPRSQVMSASLGTSCPDCYDRMSG